MTIRSQSERETLALAARMAKKAAPGVVCLRGDLGSGKTTFVRGFLRALGHRADVPSPTFAIVNEYPGLSPRVYHMDFYRLERESELDGIDLTGYIDDEEALTLIEWPEIALPRLPKDRLEIDIAHEKNGSRRIVLKARGAAARAMTGAARRRR